MKIAGELASLLESTTALILNESFFACFGFQGHHFMIATLPWPPYTYMNPAGFTADGIMKYKIAGYNAEVFDYLQVSDAALKEVMAMII